MLQAHSLLWHYLWVAPNVFLLALSLVLWRRKFYRDFPVFFFFIVALALVQLTLYVADIMPSIGPLAWWRVFWAALLIEALLKFALIGEIFGRLFGRYPSIGKLGRYLISAAGAFLVLLAVVIAAYTPRDSSNWIVSGAHILELTIYFVECGLILCLFALACYFKLRWNRSSFGIALGLGVSACIHLATWALIANGSFPEKYRIFPIFLNMVTYHVCVLVWGYYLLLPKKNPVRTVVALPQNNLELWNRELERLLRP